MMKENSCKTADPYFKQLRPAAGGTAKGKEAATHTVHLRLLSASALITNRIIAYRSLRPDVNFQLYQIPGQEDDFDVCVTARRADTAPKENDDATVMLEEDLYLAVPSHSPYGSRESIRLTDTKMPIISALAVPSPSARSQTAILWKLDLLPILSLKATLRSLCET